MLVKVISNIYLILLLTNFANLFILMSKSVGKKYFMDTSVSVSAIM